MSLWLKSFLNNKAYCTKGTKGFNAEISADANSNAIGAKGASLTNYGTGGEGGISGTNSYLGKNAAGFWFRRRRELQYMI